MKEPLVGWRCRLLFVLAFVLLAVLAAACSPLEDNREEVRDALRASYEEIYGSRVYWAEEAPDQPQVGDVRLESMTQLGETDLEDGVGALFEVTKSIYGRQNGGSQWIPMETGQEVLVWPGDGEGVWVLGPPDFSTEGLTPEQIIRQTVRNRQAIVVVD